MEKIEAKKYVVYEDKMMLAQQGERYVEMRENESAELCGEVFDTLDEAQEFLESTVNSWDKPYEITRTKRGLDTVSYNCAWIQVEEYDDDGMLEDDPIVLESYDSLPDEVRDAAMKHQREYWKFLDYEKDSYKPLNV